MNSLLNGIKHLGHASIRIEGDKVIYVDPFKIDGEPKDADLIFITHSHHDHFSTEDIRKLRRKETLLVLPVNCVSLAAELGWHNSLPVEVGTSSVAEGIPFVAVPAYNLSKHYHEKSRGWVGYIITVNDIRYYIAGDTDAIPEMASFVCDVAFLPVGGTYTMNSKEAIEAVKMLKPKLAVPTHYGTVIGSDADAKEFLQNLPEGVEGELI